MNRSYVLNRSRDDHNRSKILANGEYSIDMGKLDEIERQNAEMRAEIERLENDKESEVQKFKI